MSHRDLDITKWEQVRETVASVAPDLIINGAAIGVDQCERDPELAIAVNRDGPAFLARAASAAGARFIHFSTNYVFSGNRTDGSFYLPEDEPDPVNIYGRTKLEGERLVSAECSASWIIRTSWVFGRGKESFLATLPERLIARRRVVAITDRFASVTYVDDLVAQLDRLVTTDAYGLYHLNNTGVCSYAEFADATAQILGLGESERNELIDRQPAAAAVLAAARPKWTPMRCDRSAAAGLPPMRPWQEALAAYVAENFSAST